MNRHGRKKKHSRYKLRYFILSEFESSCYIPGIILRSRRIGYLSRVRTGFSYHTDYLIRPLDINRKRVSVPGIKPEWNSELLLILKLGP